MSGAEKLVGKGDMLFNPLGSGKPLRVQGTFISDTEVHRVIEFVKEQAEDVEYSGDVMDSIEKANSSPEGGSRQEDTDELLPDAIELVVQSQQASVSMLQRRFRIGYNRAARIIDMDGRKGRSWGLLTKQAETRAHNRGGSHEHEGQRRGEMKE